MSVDYDYGQISPLVAEYVALKETITNSQQYDCHFDTSVIDAMNVGFRNFTGRDLC